MNKSNVTNILLAGVGGQGAILASEVLAIAAAKEKAEVKQTEVHGVAQRGGSVVSHVRYGDKVYSPVVKRGDADAFLAFEKLEAVRYAHYLKAGGLLIINDLEVEPGQFGAKQDYPTGIIEFLQTKGYKILVIPALEKSLELGNAKVASLVMLGALARFLDIKQETWDAVLEERIPPKILEVNKKAFRAGYELAAATA